NHLRTHLWAGTLARATPPAQRLVVAGWDDTHCHSRDGTHSCRYSGRPQSAPRRPQYEYDHTRQGLDLDGHPQGASRPTTDQDLFTHTPNNATGGPGRLDV